MPPHRAIAGRIATVAALAALLMLVAPWPVARAATTLTVNTTADDVDAVPGDGICATAGGKCSLRAAVQTVFTLGYGNTIVVPAGTYTLSRPYDANDISGAWGDLDVAGSQTIKGAGSGKTIIQAGATSADAVDRVFDLRTPSAVYKLSGMTIRNGVGVNFGGGINVSSPAIVSLTDVVITGNHAQSGGGIYGQGQLTITDSVIASNVAGSAAGINWGGNLTIRTSTIRSNTSTGLFGDGAIRFTRVPAAPASTLLIDRSVISGNTARVAAAVSIGEGNNDSSSAFIRNSTITGNTATDAGATVIRVTAPAQLDFENATVALNKTAAVKPPSKSAISAKNSIFAANGDKSCLAPMSSLGHNLDAGSSCGLSGAGDLKNTNPRLSALGSYGGPTKSMALASNSPAIDAGAGCPSIDQRGQGRPKDGNGDGVKACDIGAYEHKAVALVASPSPSPTARASASPSPEITAVPSLDPSPVATAEPSGEPTTAASTDASAGPTAASTGASTPAATAAPAVDPASGGVGTWGIALVVIGLIVVALVMLALARRRSSGSAR
jgi:CSLREA domain-containing protein